MIKEALKSAIGISIGVMFGGCILPRLFEGELYNETWPPLWKQAIVYFVVGYITSFLVSLFFNWLRSRKSR